MGHARHPRAIGTAVKRLLIADQMFEMQYGPNNHRHVQPRLVYTGCVLAPALSVGYGMPFITRVRRLELLGSNVSSATPLCISATLTLQPDLFKSVRVRCSEVAPLKSTHHVSSVGPTLLSSAQPFH